MQRVLRTHNKRHETYQDGKKGGHVDYEELSELEKSEINDLNKVRKILFKNNDYPQPETFLFRLAENKAELRGLQQEILHSQLKNIYNRESRVLNRYYNSLSKDEQPNDMLGREFKVKVVEDLKRKIVAARERWVKETDPQRENLERKYQMIIKKI